MNQSNIEIGKRIRELREQQGYTREKFAELAGINEKYLYEVETGKKDLSEQKIYDVSFTLGVTMDYLESGKQS